LKLSELESKLSELSAGDGLALISELYPAEVVFSTSLGQEDQVITHFIAQRSLPITIFSLDTGRLFAETLDLLARTESKYNLRIKLYYPQTDAVQNLVADQGINGFYDAVQNRKACCRVRKVEPLNFA
jgi:phosphoadenosine phosphosulfate reductase